MNRGGIAGDWCGLSPYWRDTDYNIIDTSAYGLNQKKEYTYTSDWDGSSSCVGGSGCSCTLSHFTKAGFRQFTMWAGTSSNTSEAKNGYHGLIIVLP